MFYCHQAKRNTFNSLPFDIQEDIAEHLSRRDLCCLMLASRDCSQFAVRALYSTIPLGNRSERADISETNYTRSLRRRQFSFLEAISQHPEYTRFVRRIIFEFTEQSGKPSDYDYPIPTPLVWRTFAKCSGVVSIEIKAREDSLIEEPELEMFPNLRRARVTGPFSGRTIARLLNASSSVHTLQVLREDWRNRSLEDINGRRTCQVISDPFGEIRGEFTCLRTLSIDMVDGMDLASLASFLSRTSTNVTLLCLKFPIQTPSATVHFDTVVWKKDWSQWLLSVLSGFTMLRDLMLKGIKLDDAVAPELLKIGFLRTVICQEAEQECANVPMD